MPPPENLTIPPSIAAEWDLLTAGTIDVLPAEEFRDKLLKSKKTGTPLRVKFGADPSAPDLHLGHSVPINKLRQFQELGHQVVFIVGDFTARIGDPTGKSETRKALNAEVVAENAKTYLDQLYLLLDPAKTEIVWNGSWFDKMSFTDVIRLASQSTVARMLERDDFAKRYADNRPIHIHEFLYPLVQGYDSVMVKSDIEIGGTDQKFNLLVGRELMREAGQPPQCIMTLPLLVGLDGVHKMSKSLGNYIGLTESADEIFGKAMSVPDEMMEDYLVLTLGYRPFDANALLADVRTGALHPRELKARIGQELAARYRGQEAGAAARERFDKIFKERETPEDIESVDLTGEGSGLTIVKVLIHPAIALAKSGGEARRLVQGGGVSLNGEKVTALDQPLPAGEHLLKVGKRHFKRISLT